MEVEGRLKGDDLDGGVDVAVYSGHCLVDI